MSTRTQVERLADFAGMALSFDAKEGQWLLYRDRQVVHRAAELADAEAFLSAWVAHVR